MIRFDAPALLYVAPVVAAAFALFALWARRARIGRALAWSVELAEMARASSGKGSVMLIGAVALVVTIALAGPRWGSHVVTTETKALNLVIAVDVSRSMLAEDVAPSRLGRAKLAAARLVHDLESDRIGLVAFAGRSFIMSPLTIDGAALQLLVDALDPEISSAGGTELSRVLKQGKELLLAGNEVADRVLVVFTDGETHDSIDAALREARELEREGVKLILVAEGTRKPSLIPIRDARGRLLQYHLDADGSQVRTVRNDSVLTLIADAARGAIVPSEMIDQAGAVRNLITGLKRSPQATTAAARNVSRAWLPALAALLLLLLHTFTRKTAALAAVLLMVGSGSVRAQASRNPADHAWRKGNLRAAAAFYVEQVKTGEGGDTAWYNAGTAGLAIGDTALAAEALRKAGNSIDPEIRFRGLFNLGLLHLRLARIDKTGALEHYNAAKKAYREALLLKPGDGDAKWNLELATRLSTPPPSNRGGGQQENPSSGEQPPPRADEPSGRNGLSVAQAEQILNSIAEEERRTRERLNRNRQRTGVKRRRDW